MTTFARPRCLFFVFSVFAPSVVFAHPGHDGGHDLTWDFAGEVTHYLTSPCHMLPAVGVGVIGWLWMRRQRAERAKRKN